MNEKDNNDKLEIPETFEYSHVVFYYTEEEKQKAYQYFDLWKFFLLRQKGLKIIEEKVFESPTTLGITIKCL